MKKVVSLLLVVVFVLAFSSVAFGFSENMLNGHDKSPAFDTHWWGSEHKSNDVAFDPTAGRVRIPPAQPGLNSSSQSNVHEDQWTDNSSVGEQDYGH